MKQKLYMVVIERMENGYPMTFFLSHYDAGRRSRMAYTRQYEMAAEFTKDEAEKYAIRFKGKLQEVEK